MRHRTTFAIALAPTLLLALASAQSVQSDRRDREAMQTVGYLLESGHLTDQKLDDRISQRAFDSYLEAFDPMKLYFDGEDVEEFNQDRDNLDDMLKIGDVRFAHRVFQRFLERVDERTELAEKVLEREFDFEIDEDYVTDPELLQFPRGAAEAEERWRKRIKYNLLSLKVDGIEDAKARERLAKRYRGFRQRIHRLERDEVVALFVTTVASSFDPHSAYLGAHELENFEIRMRLDYQGIGALLGERDGEAFVDRIMPGGPAEKYGKLEAGSQVVGVGEGDDGEIKDVVGMRLRDIVQLIRGKANTVVRLEVIPENSSEKLVHRLVRGRTELKDDAAHAEVFDHAVGSDHVQVGVIDLPSFYGSVQRRPGANAPSATRDVRRFLEDFAKRGVDVAVLDLRRNGGGYLSEAVHLAGLFIDTGPVVQVRGYQMGRVEVLEDTVEGVSWNGPLVVLTSKMSASASEIVAGAIKDYGRGLVVGDDTSHGKGTVQRVVPLDPPGSKPRLGALKLTFQKFYRPSGMSTQVRGVPADVVLPSFSNAAGIGEAELPHSLPYDEVGASRYGQYGRASDRVVELVQKASAARRAKSEKFQELADRIAAYKRVRDRKSVPLLETEFRTMREELDSNARETDALEGVDVSDEPKINRDEYLDEVLAIAADYARVLQGKKLAQVK